MGHTLTRTVLRGALRPLLLGGVLALVGCQLHSTARKAPVPLTEQQQLALEKRVFIRNMKRVLRRDVISANAELWQGGLQLVIQLDRQSRVLECSTRPIADYPLSKYPDNARLAPLLEHLCWTSVLPQVPGHLYDSKGTTMVVAPLIFDLSKASERDLQQIGMVSLQYQQREFLWQRMFAGQGIDSTGVARLQIQADVQGQVQQCLVNLERHALRRSEFKIDSDLQNRLIQACTQLDLRQMPGFQLDPSGVARLDLSIEYSPGKGGPGQRPGGAQALR